MTQEAKAILKGGWLDGRLIDYDDKDILTAIGPGILSTEAMIFVNSGGHTLEGKVKMVKYKKAKKKEKGLTVYKLMEEEEGDAEASS